MVKTHCAMKGREVVRTAREVQGANGLLWENMTIKAIIDMEGAEAGEGTNEVNVLVAGRELTGLAAFK